MIIQFALKDFMVYLLCALGIAVAILMIPVLLNIKKVTEIVRATLVKNQESIHKTFRSLPSILENAEQVSHNSKEITSQLKSSVPMIVNEVEGVTRAAKGGIESAGEVLEKMGSGINNTVASYKDTPEHNTEEASGFMVYVLLIKEALQVINKAFKSKR